MQVLEEINTAFLPYTTAAAWGAELVAASEPPSYQCDLVENKELVVAAAGSHQCR